MGQVKIEEPVVKVLNALTDYSVIEGDMRSLDDCMAQEEIVWIPCGRRSRTWLKVPRIIDHRMKAWPKDVKGVYWKLVELMPALKRQAWDYDCTMHTLIVHVFIDYPIGSHRSTPYSRRRCVISPRIEIWRLGREHMSFEHIVSELQDMILNEVTRITRLELGIEAK